MIMLKYETHNSLVYILELYMNRSEVSGMTAVSTAAPDEGGESDGPDLRSGLLHLNIADRYLEA
jgi:hypothetical protein